MAYEFKQIRRVEFADTDLAGIMHFANFFRFMEVAEHAFYRSLGLRIHAPSENQSGWPRVAASCEYKAPLRFDDEVEIHVLVTEKGRKSLSFLHVFSRVDGDDRVEVARGRMTAVSVGIDGVGGKMKAVALPEEFDRRIEAAPIEALPPDEAADGNVSGHAGSGAGRSGAGRSGAGGEVR